MRYAFIPVLVALVIGIGLAGKRKTEAGNAFSGIEPIERGGERHIESPAPQPEDNSTGPFKLEDVKMFHAKQVENFVSMTGFGLSRVKPMRSRHTLPVSAPNGKITTYTMSKRELIGLFVNPQPVVYSRLNWEDMNSEAINSARSTMQIAATQVPHKIIPSTRELDAFETAALAKLRAGRDIVVHEETDAVRIVGSIRATSDCMSCHTCKERDLLGAFTYRLESAATLRAAAIDR